MIRPFNFAVIFFALPVFCISQSKTDTQVLWEDEFTTTEKEQLTTWLNGVSEVVANTLGPYAFPVNLYVHLSERGGEPVPWANTVRHEEQAVRFYVDPSFSLEDFQLDWTAPHELAHLSLPFLGRENMWFAEGYASFMQWYLLEKQGVLSSKVIEEKYRSKLQNATKKYDKDTPFIEKCRELLQRNDYPAVYWGGACYFFQVDAALRSQRNTDLFSVIKEYQRDGRMQDRDLNDLISSLDRISKSEIFSSTLRKFEENSGWEALEGTIVPLRK